MWLALQAPVRWPEQSGPGHWLPGRGRVALTTFLLLIGHRKCRQSQSAFQSSPPQEGAGAVASWQAPSQALAGVLLPGPGPQGRGGVARGG